MATFLLEDSIGIGPWEWTYHLTGRTIERYAQSHPNVIHITSSRTDRAPMGRSGFVNRHALVVDGAGEAKTVQVFLLYSG